MRANLLILCDRDRNHAAASLFDAQLVARLVNDHLAGVRDNGQLLWLLSNVYLWHDVHGLSNSRSGPELLAS